jgi:hypothetical protein
VYSYFLAFDFINMPRSTFSHHCLVFARARLKVFNTEVFQPSKLWVCAYLCAIIVGKLSPTGELELSELFR